MPALARPDCLLPLLRAMGHGANDIFTSRIQTGTNSALHGHSDRGGDLVTSHRAAEAAGHGSKSRLFRCERNEAIASRRAGIMMSDTAGLRDLKPATRRTCSGTPG